MLMNRENEKKKIVKREFMMAASSLRVIKRLTLRDIKEIMKHKDNPIAFWTGERWDSFDESMSSALWGYDSI